MQQPPKVVIPQQFITTPRVAEQPQIAKPAFTVPTVPKPVPTPVVVPRLPGAVPPTAPIEGNIPQPRTIAQTTVPVPRLPQPTTNQTLVLPRQPPTQEARTLTVQPTVPRPIVTLPPQGGTLKQFAGGTGVVTVTTPQTTAAPVINIVEDTGYSILIKLIDVWEGTVEQAQQLTALRYQNGNSIIDINRRDVIMEIIGMLRIQPFDEILDFLTDALDPGFILWEQESMDEGRVKVAREIVIQQAEEVGVKRVGKCRYCPSTELVFATKQLRSGDEPATIFVRCVMCQKNWRQ